MRKTAIFGLCAVAMASAAAAMAQEPAPATPGKASNERQICRTYREVGTRLGGYRTCKTAAEWAELRRQMRENVDRMQTHVAMNAPGS